MNFLEKNYYALVLEGKWKLSQITNEKMRNTVREELKNNGIYQDSME